MQIVGSIEVNVKTHNQLAFNQNGEEKKQPLQVPKSKFNVNQEYQVSSFILEIKVTRGSVVNVRVTPYGYPST